PSVVKAATRFFAYRPPPNHHVYEQDARVFLQTTGQRYDIIWVDVFARHLIPFHLTTREFFAELRNHLTPHGVVAVNLASSNAKMDQLRAEAIRSTMKTAFPLVEVFGVAGPSWLKTKPGAVNLIFFARREGSSPTMQTEAFRAMASKLVMQGKLPPEVLVLLTTARPNQTTEWKPGIILTDDFSPLDILQGG
ncbi:MAG: hypothetical protein D6704_08165, partial [Nitrospirae bacterium]